ncbi:F-box/WD repeat-containing protein 12 isoform X1 [Vicugna pacos]|uniref:F-box/WD repeat-containing protein 12 isoform X1 n=2 Tax=Vicugna pacos TaxID=30538 RepID=A0A6J3B8H0_VICPA|nr:F-box/WD repeat-containing protein 12 isoform X1 [Vicugna pacos]XP_031542458.1 F-box/WD repeat-containing protein 12 isoform X1 [Vicugna pacos]XP_031542459.1 F-box/WD repeat-containing protein 12 isoform X1 [Vicugna pacos]XP_031542460.1 F-box/WD repeat-containing protein 12 isoform X1 [Vicugna pacos]XP_031542461.1 F-box/WD repeat-containing protein 12 isoform X1 [Vicugna pacos]XP_031542463.1 F-box/WD repeat-containing protein 12 isoform X1 [Vicugna pacos]XP_031542464.1 F-box/WD repeat-cont
MEGRLPDEVLFRIFSFLDASSLLHVAQVNKYWNKVAESEPLWRNLCRRKWSFCTFSHRCPGAQTWKQYFLKQTRQERWMASAKPENFVYKAAVGNLGILGPMAYLSGSGPTMDEEKSIICTVSSKRMLFAWDVREGTMIWSSPVQQSSIMHLATLPQMHLAFTVDLKGAIKVWNCQDEDTLATLIMSQACLSLEAFLTKDGPFLMVGTCEGDIYTLTVPELKTVSKVNAFKYRVDLLYCSPDKRWIFASGTHECILPKVFFTECLLRPSEGRTPLSLSLPLSSCCRACWAPRRTNRVTLMFQKDALKKTGFTTLDLTTEGTGGRTFIQAHEVASFLLPVHMESPIWMGVSDGNTIVFESGPYLFLVSISGHLLQRFEYHDKTICNLWVDSLHVLTTSVDDSLHVYMWEEEGRYPYLRSCCHLEHIGSDQTPSCYVPKAICDNKSIVCVVSRIRESSILVMYSLNM